MPEAPVLIIGAGVAGLTLAQGLRLRSVPFRIFERHPQSRSHQGHRFRISEEGQAALNSVLSPYLQDLLRLTAPEKNHLEPRYVDATKLSFPKPSPAKSGSIPVDRAWIRSLCTLYIEDAIEYEKSFESYTVTNDGVTVRFKDGSLVSGRLLVGADGIKSQVRRQRQPHRKLLDLERWVMWSRTPLTEQLKKTVPDDVLTWCMYLDDANNVQTVVEPVAWQASVRVESQARLPDFQDYMYWVICTAPFQFSETFPATVREKQHFLAKATKDWHPALQTLILTATHEKSVCAPVWSSKPDIEIWAADGEKRVTLVGDAAHPMSPMGGSGGDTAIRITADLAITIAREGTDSSSIKNFEARMEALAKEKIEHSFRGGQKFWRGKEWPEYGYTQSQVTTQ